MYFNLYLSYSFIKTFLGLSKSFWFLNKLPESIFLAFDSWRTSDKILYELIYDCLNSSAFNKLYLDDPGEKAYSGLLNLLLAIFFIIPV
jgi:hypothetical protein